MAKKPAGVDKKTNLVKPLVEMTPKQQTKAREEKPVKSAVGPKVKLPGEMPKRTLPRGTRAAKNSELRKGVTSVTETETTPRTPKKRAVTKTGKKIDPKTGKIRAPRKGQIAKVDGKLVRVDDTNVAEATKARNTTVLPTADRDVVEGATTPTMRPPSRPTVVKETPRGPAGPAVSHEEISDLVTKARGHLTQMTLTRNTPAYHDHHESFNLVHAQLEKKAPAAHQILGIMRHLTVNPNPQSADHFELADKALGDTLSAYKAKSTHNVAASRAGRAERIRRIKAERAGTTE
jgi:hypothetical protein